MDYAIARFLSQDPDKWNDLKAGRIVEAMGKHYAVCGTCECIIRVDKPILGSTHFCVGEEENV